MDLAGRQVTGRATAVRLALLAGPVAFLAVFFLYPVTAIVGQGLREDGAWHLGRVGEVLGDGDTAGILWFTVWQAAASTLLTLAVGLPAAWAFARLRFPGRRVLHAAVTVPFVLPTVVTGAAFLALVGRGGLLDDWWGVRLDESVWAILLAHASLNFAVVVRIVGGLWSQLDPRQEEAARMLGATRRAAWLRVTLPALTPAVASAAVMVFLFTFTSFGVVQILGGPRNGTLEVEIYRQTAQLLDLPTAAVLTLLQFALVAVLLGVQALLTRRTESALSLVDPATTARRPRGAAERVTLGAVLTVIALLLLLPLGVLLERSLSVPGGGYGFGNYSSLFTTEGGTFVTAPWSAVGTSLRYAAVATAIAVVVGALAATALARRGGGRLLRGFDALLMLPLGTSAVTVGFGFLITLDEPPLDLRSSWLLVPLAQALVGVPFVVRVLLPVLRAVDDRLRQAAAVLGASPARVWREVDVPLVRRAVLVAAGFAFAVSLGEFGATVFIARADNPTLPVAVARLLSRPGALNYGQAMALSAVLMLVCTVTLLALERLRPAERTTP
ncbi:iron ABC transporter permease [Streptomyces sp. NPDC049881]|uniref:ABC transporter permease n=1 Tax=Streptomyces sp. NPDC049881 TaxID=3155778 RepID=UPI003446203D